MMEAKLKELKERLLEINSLKSVVGLLYWDQATYMPPGGADARARQMSTLEKISHEKFIDPAIGKLLEELKPYEESQPFDSYEASLIRVTRREYERAIKVPSSFQAELTSHSSKCFDVWSKARPENNFSKVQPHLEKMLDLSVKLANFFPGYEHIADPLIDFNDYGMKTSMIRALFQELREELVPIVQKITSQKVADDSCLRQNFSEEKQLAFGIDVVKRLGYDFQRGRQDKTHHPFTVEFSIGDVRITTRIKENDLNDALFSTIHEAGHAMYEQGISMEFEGTPLAIGTSSGVHESQSRMWENIVGRSRGFWKYFYPRLQEVFPDQLKSVPLDMFYRAINKVQRSLIRTDADEVTYNLHIMIRFDLELQLLEGKLSVADLPEAWRERYKADLGVEPPDDRDGVLQDVHWYSDHIGGTFQCYTLGNIMCSQFYEAALLAHPEIPSEIENGKFDTLHNWLKENIYQHGSKYTASELIQRVTGKELTIEPYIKYLKTKFGELYNL
jgi:carboxypeptidase Taq